MNHQTHRRSMKFNGKNGKYNKPHNFHDDTRDFELKEEGRSRVHNDFEHFGQTRPDRRNTSMHYNRGRLGMEPRLIDRNRRENTGRRSPLFNNGNDRGYSRNVSYDENRERDSHKRRNEQNARHSLLEIKEDFQEQREYRNTRSPDFENRGRQNAEGSSHYFNKHLNTKRAKTGTNFERGNSNAFLSERCQEENWDTEGNYDSYLSHQMLPGRYGDNQLECELSPVSSEPIEEYSVEDKVSILLNIILENGGEIEIEELQNHWIENLGKHYPKVFEFATETVEEAEEGESPEETGNVRAKTEATLCQAHANVPNSCKGGCDALHICKFYILSSCGMTNCKFIHDFENEHNRKAKCKYFLHRVKLQNICRLLQHDANRCRVTVPVICRYYNTNGCRSGDSGRMQQSPRKCPYLHLCSKYVDGQCYAGGLCRQNHSLLEGPVLEILIKYNLDPREWNQGKTRIMSLLRWSSNDFKENKKNWSISYKVKKSYNDLSKEKITRKRKLFGEEKTVNLAVKMPKISDARSFSSQDVNKSCSWSISDGNSNEDIPEDIVKYLEDKHRKYLLAKTTTVNLKGKSLMVDFETLKGRFDGSTSEVKIHRNILNKKHSDEKKGTSSDQLETTTSEDGYSSTSSDVSVWGGPFEKVKDAEFIKI
ncbi:poly [ADP-ribose] polymerase 7/11/12/13 [Mytilus galloprovincialis]|uniref:Poly [ADP-ribose] polymerase 7/11/12/13 n=1 Tax=Mytilus galloprovincialis TaxID=29158 RepID=A0A8B6C0S8_MYTGA|nr:poly [ADP-ribose] polymerase 7/11/12/13 [Mytilus galloprovincialis]